MYPGEGHGGCTYTGNRGGATLTEIPTSQWAKDATGKANASIATNSVREKNEALMTRLLSRAHPSLRPGPTITHLKVSNRGLARTCSSRETCVTRRSSDEHCFMFETNRGRGRATRCAMHQNLEWVDQRVGL